MINTLVSPPLLNGRSHNYICISEIGMQLEPKHFLLLICSTAVMKPSKMVSRKI